VTGTRSKLKQAKGFKGACSSSDYLLCKLTFLFWWGFRAVKHICINLFQHAGNGFFKNIVVRLEVMLCFVLCLACGVLTTWMWKSLMSFLTTMLPTAPLLTFWKAGRLGRHADRTRAALANRRLPASCRPGLSLLNVKSPWFW
jgi:hypothetical protein